MQLRTKWGALVLVALLLGSLGTAGLVLAKSDSSAPAAQTSASSSLPATLQTAPLNPAYVQYQQEKAAGKVQTQTVDGHGLGWVPPPVKPATLTTAASSLTQAQTYPATYDLRNYGKVSPVEDQGSCGSCWTFATFGSLESYLLPGLTTHYSENSLNINNGFDYGCCNGGDSAMSTAYLARWGSTMTYANGGTIYAGPVSATCDPYSSYTGSCGADTTTCPVAEHVQNVYYVPLKTGPLDNNAIKSAVTTYGGVYSAFYWDPNTSPSSSSSYWNVNTAAYYYDNSVTANHAVTIVGWNDNYPATNFATQPRGNGAWLCKNSWGASFGQQGYFYVSYYDANMGYQDNAVFTAQPTTNYDTNYQYDPLGWVSSIGGSTAWGANVFTATSNQQLSAVSFYAGSANTHYQIYVYTDPTSGSPTSGTLYTGPSGTEAWGGYYTIPLTTPVPLTAGHQFSVVMEITTPGSSAIPVEYAQSGYSSEATAQPGHSYYSAGGASWTDTYTMNPTESVCIQAFAKTLGVAGAPAVSAQNTNSLGLFFRGTDNALWNQYWTGTAWSAPTSLGGTLTSDPAVTSRNPGGLTVFVRGTDGTVYYRDYVGGSWGPWASIGGQTPAGSAPAVASWGGGRLDVFAEGMNGGLYQKTYTPTGGWSGWQYLGGTLTSGPGATSRNPGGLTVFVRGPDGGIWYRDYVAGSWGPWASIGGSVAANAAPAACSWGSGRLDVFVECTNGAAYQKTYTPTGGWSGWQYLGGTLTSGPGATSPGNGLIDLFVRGPDKGLWENSYDGAWPGWTSVAL